MLLGHLLILDGAFKSFLPLINIGLLINQIVALILQFLQLSISIRSHQQSRLALLLIEFFEPGRLLLVPVDLLETHLHVGLAPHFA